METRIYNKHQTQLDDELMNSLEQEERRDLLDVIDSIQFIQNLSSTDRKRACDLDRWNHPFYELEPIDPKSKKRELDPEGRIIVDITRPICTGKRPSPNMRARSQSIRYLKFVFTSKTKRTKARNRQSELNKASAIFSAQRPTEPAVIRIRLTDKAGPAGDSAQ